MPGSGHISMAVEFGDSGGLLGDFKAPWVSNDTKSVASQYCVSSYTFLPLNTSLQSASDTLVWLPSNGVHIFIYACVYVHNMHILV